MGSKRETRYGMVFSVPVMIVLILGFAFPLFRVIKLAFTSPSGTFGIDNFSRVFSDDALLSCLSRSLTFTVISVASHLLLGLLLASLMNYKLRPGFVKFARSCMIIPWAISPIVVAMIWRLLYQPEMSALSSLYKLFPVMAQGVLSNEKFALFAIILMNVWFATPFYFLMFLARLQSIPGEIYEAASIDGCTYLQSIFKISLPALRSLIVTLSLYDVVASLNTFDIIWMTTSGGPNGATEVLATYVYRMAFRKLDFEYAAAIGIVLLLVVLLVCGIVWWLGQEKNSVPAHRRHVGKETSDAGR